MSDIGYHKKVPNLVEDEDTYTKVNKPEQVVY